MSGVKGKSGVYKRTKPNSMQGKHHTEESKKKMSEAAKGRTMPEEQRKKISESLKGEKCYLWKGGINPANDTIRKSVELRLWREAVFARDNFTCQKTGVRGGELNSHHICNFADYPELRTSIENGLTLSKKSHRVFHNKYGYKNNTQEQIDEFLSKRDE